MELLVVPLYHPDRHRQQIAGASGEPCPRLLGMGFEHDSSGWRCPRVAHEVWNAVPLGGCASSLRTDRWPGPRLLWAAPPKMADWIAERSGAWCLCVAVPCTLGRGIARFPWVVMFLHAGVATVPLGGGARRLQTGRRSGSSWWWRHLCCFPGKGLEHGSSG